MRMTNRSSSSFHLRLSQEHRGRSQQHLRPILDTEAVLKEDRRGTLWNTCMPDTSGRSRACQTALPLKPIRNNEKRPNRPEPTGMTRRHGKDEEEDASGRDPSGAGLSNEGRVRWKQ